MIFHINLIHPTGCVLYKGRLTWGGSGAIKGGHLVRTPLSKLSMGGDGLCPPWCGTASTQYSTHRKGCLFVIKIPNGLGIAWVVQQELRKQECFRKAEAKWSPRSQVAEWQWDEGGKGRMDCILHSMAFTHILDSYYNHLSHVPPKSCVSLCCVSPPPPLSTW